MFPSPMSQPDTTTQETAEESAEKIGFAPSMNSAGKMLGVTSRTLRNWRKEGCPGFEADGRVDCDAVAEWHRTRTAERGGSESSVEEKRREEIRKLRLANDHKEGRLIERAVVAERLQRCAHAVHAFRSKSEAEHPTRFAAAAGDIAECRTVLRTIWDEIFRDIESLAKHFEETGS